MIATTDDGRDDFHRSWWDRVRRPTWRGWFSVVCLLLLLGAATWWAVDAATLGDRVARNVSVGGVDVGRRGPGALTGAIDRAATVYGNASVELVTDRQTLHLRGKDLGLDLDRAATARDARAVGRDDNPLARPFLWAASFVRTRQSPVHVTVNLDRLAFALATLPGQTPVQEPTVVGSPSSFGISRSHGGIGYDPDEVARQIERAAADGDLPIRIKLTLRDIEPRHTDEEALALAKQATALVAAPLELRALDKVATADQATLRSWITSRPGPDGLELVVDDTLARRGAALLLGDEIRAPVDAAFTVVKDEVSIVPEQDGERCCAAKTGDAVLAALRAHQPVAYVPLIPVKAQFRTDDARKLGITTRVGSVLDAEGFHQDRAYTVGFNPATGVGPNVELAADMLRGRILRPNQSLSLNALLGPPSPERGYVPAQVPTLDGLAMVPGAGTDVVATALFNAAFFGGLAIPSATAHEVQIAGIPPGRDANLGWPGPDLVVQNDSANAVLIWTRLTPTTVTVMLFSTPGISGAQTGQKVTPSGPDGVCQTIVTQRTRTRSDGSTATDSFTAHYAPPAPEPGQRVAC